MNELQFEVHGYLKRWSAYTLNYTIMNILQWNKIFTHNMCINWKIESLLYSRSFSSISHFKEARLLNQAIKPLFFLRTKILYHNLMQNVHMKFTFLHSIFSE